MMFDLLCVNKIKERNKIETRRIKRNNRRPAIPGTVHKLKIDRTQDIYGYIKILDCRIEKDIWNIKYTDAIKEGFDNPTDFIKYWLEVNNNYKGENIWVVEFEYLGETLE